MKKQFTDEEILMTPLAAGAAVFFCPAADCWSPHILLTDADNEPLAHFVVGDDLFAELHNAMRSRYVEIVWPERRMVSKAEIERQFLAALTKNLVQPALDMTAMAEALDKAGIIRLAK
jgi:uncharacterized membrane protein